MPKQNKKKMTIRPFPRSRYMLYGFTAFVCFAVDLATKSLAFQKCGMPGEKEPCWLISNVLGVQTSLNEGALFGMGQGYTLFFCFMSIVALLMLWSWLFFGKAAASRYWTLTFGLITGGILGNLYDRLGLHGLTWDWFFIPCSKVNETLVPIHKIGEPVYAVRDWILVMIGTYHWPNFNLADVYLNVGLALILLDVFLNPNRWEGKKVAEKENPKIEC